jgi:hypothetical protein
MSKKLEIRAALVLIIVATATSHSCSNVGSQTSRLKKGIVLPDQKFPEYTLSSGSLGSMSISLSLYVPCILSSLQSYLLSV